MKTMFIIEHTYQCKETMSVKSFVFFFQAEDGIRDVAVTGVQTCALPIFTLAHSFHKWHARSCDMNLGFTMNKDQLDGLLALKLVADKRNFTAAADELGISPPAISKMIKQLESRLGVALLSRTTRSTSLTEAGERFLNQAGAALDQILAALKDVGA